ncbi:hypothetical protein ABBQ32_005152 [Trebouxia sp. C0010 RCD-2024]
MMTAITRFTPRRWMALSSTGTIHQAGCCVPSQSRTQFTAWSSQQEESWPTCSVNGYQRKLGRCCFLTWQTVPWRHTACDCTSRLNTWVAAGDNTGRIMIWTDFKDQVPNVQKATPAATAVPSTSPAVPNAAAHHKSNVDSDNDSSDDAQQHPASAHQQQQSNLRGDSAVISRDTGSVGAAVGLFHDRLAGLQRSRAAVPVTTLHWHAHPVRTLCFSGDGTLLLSGGEEAVLVVWQLDSSHRTFLPRLGGPLTCITRSAVDAACYVISLADNTVHMVNTARMKVEMSIHGMRGPPRGATPLQSTSAAVLVPGSGHLVMPTDNSMLQFWDAARDRHVAKLQVAPRNTIRVSQQQGELSGMRLEPHVSHVAFSNDGLVMATVDVRPNAGSLGSDEQTLRFWDWTEAGNSLASPQDAPMYSMNTYLDDPHRGGCVSSLAYHPSRNMAATTGSSGDVKIWVQQGSSSRGTAAHWRCQSVGSHTGGAMSAAAFSSDGSLLAAATGDQVTLWDPYSSAIISCLASPPANKASPLQKLCFVPNSPYLVGYTMGANPSLIAWNLITESVWWSYQLAVSALAADYKGESVAVAVLPKSFGVNAKTCEKTQSSTGASEQAEGDAISHEKVSSPADKVLRQGATTVTQSDQSAAASAVFLFNVITGVPQLSWSLGQSVAAALLFPLPGTNLHASSVPLTPDGLSPVMIILQDRQYAVARSANLQDASVQADVLKHGRELNAFEAAFGPAGVLQSAKQRSVPVHFQSEGQSRFQTIFDAPSHVLPSLTNLAPRFFDSLVEYSGQLA